MTQCHYQLLLVRAAEKDLLRLMRSDRKRVLEAIQSLADDPRPHGCKNLVGGEGHRIRVGVYRVTYCIDDANAKVEVRSVLHRKDAYR